MEDCNKSNHLAKSETIQKKRDLIRLDQRKTIHEKFQCQFCPEKLATGSEMSAHVISVHAIKWKPCPAQFFTTKELDKHIHCDPLMMQQKEARRKHPCHVCFLRAS